MAFFGLTQIFIVLLHVCCGVDERNKKQKRLDSMNEKFNYNMSVAAKSRSLVAQSYFTWHETDKKQTRAQELVDNDIDEIIHRTVEDEVIRVRIAYDLEADRLKKLESYLLRRKVEADAKAKAALAPGLLAGVFQASAAASAIRQEEAERTRKLEELLDIEAGLQAGQFKGEAGQAELRARLKTVTQSGVRTLEQAREMPRWAIADRARYVEELTRAKPHLAAGLLRRRAQVQPYSGEGEGGEVDAINAEAEKDTVMELEDLQRLVDERELMHHVNRVRTEEFLEKVRRASLLAIGRHFACASMLRMISAPTFSSPQKSPFSPL